MKKRAFFFCIFAPNKKTRMGKFQKIKKFWSVIVSEWKTRYRLVFSNEETHEQSFVIKKITIQKMVVFIILASFVLILLTTVIIALTPLRMYIPGYTTQKDYKIYKQTVMKMDSMERTIRYNQEYIDHLSKMLSGDVPTTDEMDRDAQTSPQTHETRRDKKRIAESEAIEKEAERILGRIRKDDGGGSDNVPGISQAKITNLSLYPPALGSVVQVFDATRKHYGIDILSVQNSIVSCIADGVVVYAGFTADDGYTIIVQHPGNLVSVYKRNAALMKKTGARVRAGEGIAKLGNSGTSEGKTNHLHFELWYNGFPINPLNYLTIE